jgi:hypothetical protein
MPRKNEIRRKHKLEKKKRKKKLRNKNRKLARTRQNKYQNIKGQVVESISPTFNRTVFTEDPNNTIVKQRNVLEKTTSKVFNKSAWKPDDGQEK